MFEYFTLTISLRKKNIKDKAIFLFRIEVLKLENKINLNCQPTLREKQ